MNISDQEVTENAIDEYILWKGWRAADFGKATAFDAFYYQAEFRKRLGDTTRLRVLEIGYGNGGSLGWLLAHGNECFGIETNAELRRRARLWGIPAYASIDNEDLRALRGTFDLVVGFDVLEHIPERELEGFLRSIHSLLKHNGRFLARFPNGDSPFGRYSQHGDYTHLTTLSSRKIFHLARHSGFDVVFAGAPQNPIWRGGLRSAVKRSVMALLKRVIDRGLRLAYYNNHPVCFDENLLVVLRRKSSDRSNERQGIA